MNYNFPQPSRVGPTALHSAIAADELIGVRRPVGNGSAPEAPKGDEDIAFPDLLTGAVETVGTTTTAQGTARSAASREGKSLPPGKTVPDTGADMPIRSEPRSMFELPMAGIEKIDLPQPRPTDADHQTAPARGKRAGTDAFLEASVRPASDFCTGSPALRPGPSASAPTLLPGSQAGEQASQSVAAAAVTPPYDGNRTVSPRASDGSNPLMADHALPLSAPSNPIVLRDIAKDARESRGIANAEIERPDGFQLIRAPSIEAEFRVERRTRPGPDTAPPSAISPPTNTALAIDTPPPARSGGDALHGHGNSATSQMPPAPAPTASPQTAAPIPEPMGNARLAPQIENAIDQISQAREWSRQSPSELTLRHQHFGSVTMTIDARGPDLRATLAARDPAFVPAVQAALAERGVVPVAESGSAMTGRGSDQHASNGSPTGQGANGHGSAGGGSPGQGSFSDRNYGNSEGSAQASRQPYRGQEENAEADAFARAERSNGLYA